MSKTLFDHLNAIYTDKTPEYWDALSEDDRKTFSAYMVNRFVSMNPNYTTTANEFQRYLNVVGPRESYLFYARALPKGKSYSKYIKRTDKETYPEWLVALLTRHFWVNSTEARYYLRLYFSSEQGKADLRGLCEQYATDPKDIKKAGL
jgi:hypothetical protein